MADELKAIHDKQDEIPEDYRELYTEKNGKWELTGIKGIRTQADIDRVQGALTKEKAEHKTTKGKLMVWGDMDPEETKKSLDRIPELEAAAGDKLDESKIDELANKRADRVLKTKLAPVERKLTAAEKERDELKVERDTLSAKATQRAIHDDMRKAGKAAKIRPEAEDDLLLHDRLFEVTDDGKVLTKDNVGVTPGLDPDAWLSEIQERKQHWWPGTVGSGAPGSGGPGGIGAKKNPWSHQHWNVTEQGRFFTKNGKEKCEKMAEAAGTTFGGSRPPASVSAK